MGYETGDLNELLITPTKNYQYFPQPLQTIHSAVAWNGYMAQWPKTKIWLEKNIVSETEFVLTECIYRCVNKIYLYISK
jgi:hypothetical protein